MVEYSDSHKKIKGKILGLYGMKNFSHRPSSFSNEPLSINSKKFKIRRFLTILIIGLSDMLVFFQRAVPTIVSEPMSKSYGLTVSDLSIFSSMFFYPYAAIQPFAGLLADVMDPRFLIGICSIIASFGAFLCGISSNLFLGCIGRFLVGFGSSPIYVPACRIIANWYPLKEYSRTVGVFCAFAGCGGLIAQGPFSRLASLFGWRWCFFIVSIVGFFLSFLVLFFVRGNPVSLGYEAVNSETSVDTSTLSLKEKMNHLCNNFFTVVKNKSFWMIGLYNFGINGAFFNINGMWGGPYLRHVYDYSLVQMGNTMMMISIGNVVGAFVIPFIAELFNTRKWFVFWCSFIALLCLFPFYLYVNELKSYQIVFLFFFYAVFSNSLTNVAYPMCREYFHASASGTAVGCVNLTAYISAIIYQIGTGMILNSKYKISIGENIRYSPEGYKFILWLPSILSTAFGMITILFAKDTKGPGNWNCCCEFNGSTIKNDEYDEKLINNRSGNFTSEFDSGTKKEEIVFQLIDPEQ